MAQGKSIKKSNKIQSRSSKAGLLFPVGRIASYLKQGTYSPQVSEKAAISMAGILEYLTREILELSVQVCKKE